jgi:polyisoprenoid-binding protein YceI
MNPEELHSLVHSGQAHVLIDVLPEEMHAAGCIPGSVNACVYEMAFLERVAGLAPSKESVIVVYGAGDGSLDSRVASGKLTAAGYVNVADFSAGLSGWQAAGFPVSGSGAPPQPPVADGRFVIDARESVIRWTGRNLFNHHSGTVKLTSGEIVLSDGVLEAASFVIDMNSIACEDLEDATWNAMLIRHLRDADFFDAERYPSASFTVTSAEPVSGCAEGNPNFLLKGDFTLRGVTRPLEFPAVIATADGRRLTGQGQFEIDRTEFGSIYGSGRFFKYLGKHVVNDHIHLHVKIHADAVTED